MKSNKRIEYARCARPTRKSDALLLAAHSRRYVSRRVSVSDSVVLAGFSSMKLEDFHYHLDWTSWEESYVELVASDERSGRRLRFRGVSNLRIDEGFNGSLSGMMVMDISDRQWAAARIEVRNSEQDPGITFLALSMEVLGDT